MKFLILIIAIITILPSCVTTDTYGTDFFMSDTLKIQKGVTTKTEVYNLFGEPYKKEIQKGGIEIWTYHFTKYEKHVLTYERKTHTKTLVIMLQNNVVNNFDHLEKHESM